LPVAKRLDKWILRQMRFNATYIFEYLKNNSLNKFFNSHRVKGAQIKKSGFKDYLENNSLLQANVIFSVFYKKFKKNIQNL